MGFIALLVFACGLHGCYCFVSLVSSKGLSYSSVHAASTLVKPFSQVGSYASSQWRFCGSVHLKSASPWQGITKCNNAALRIGEGPQPVSFRLSFLVADMGAPNSLQYSSFRHPLVADMGSPNSCHQLAFVKSLPSWGGATNTRMRRFRHLLVLRKRLLSRGRMNGEIRVANFQPICSGLLRGGYAC